MSETEQVKSEDSQSEIPIEIKPKNPKRVEAGKKGAEARRLKRMKQPVMEITKPESTTPEKLVEKPINVYKTYLPACVVILGIAVLYMYRNKPVQQVNEPINEPIETDTKQYDPFEF